MGGGGITTLDTYCTFTNIPGPGIRTAYFAALGSWPGGAPEERREPAEQRCAYARRCSEGVAAPLGCVICLQLGDVAVFSLCAQYFLNVRGGGGITTLGAFHTFRKPCVAGYQNGKLCRFWVLAGCTPEGRRKPAGQRCAYARRCSEASRPRWAALLCLQFGDVAVFSLCVQYFLNVQGGRALSLPSACSACF